jgi:hypothetical protein
MALTLFRRVQLRELRPRAQATPDNTVSIEPGVYSQSTGTGVVRKSSAFNSPTFPAIVTGGNVRYDVLCLDDSGTASIVSGTEVSAPGDPIANAPTMPSDKLALAIVRILETGTVLIDGSDITDIREFLNKGGGGSGTQGWQGAQGFQGWQGWQGWQGVIGVGTDGAQGWQGVAGISPASQWSMVTQPMTVGQTVFTVPFTYTVGNHQLVVMRNGVVQVVGIDYAETTSTSVTLTVGVSATNETLVFAMFGSAVSSGSPQWSMYTQPMTVGQTLFAVPFTYVIGVHQLKVWRNGVYQLVGVDYTETSSTSITVSPAIAVTTEELIVEILGGGGGVSWPTFVGI